MSSCSVAAAQSIARLEPAAVAATEDDRIPPLPLRLFLFAPAGAALTALTPHSFAAALHPFAVAAPQHHFALPVC